MEKSFKFGTDSRLIVNVWNQDAVQATGIAAGNALGKKYYMVLPRIFVDNRDALVKVLRTARPVAIKGHYFNSVLGQVKSDVEISPIMDKRHRAGGAEVQIRTYPARPESATTGIQSLIDTGRTATAFVHSVRNPLNAIMGAVVYLRGRYPQESTLKEFTDIIELEAKRLNDFISRFLSSSVSEAEISEVDVNDIIKKIEMLTALQAASRDIRFTYSYGDVPPAQANSFQIEHAILNIVNNAIEVLKAGDGFSVKTSVDNDNGNCMVVIEISDTGPGLQLFGEDVLVFPKKGEGKGFGLLLTRELVRQNGGRMDIKSGKGGTLVRLYIPAADGFAG
ncbi:MAG TPA: hypothetical protein DDW94_02780 [Deltaproteobacteria bacterium]|nr:MAG: hypothetical protein A2Z79_09065 [Deltaproteobacteria bacterium GWA2_55_82]OGQ64616.1 MAG: hypothetical protein A3I81_11330 [Deltaproteobacteria bacterium RIFCSPLOWO2_02_FULL_55_12]OIJ73714.1 MAG: hypothetical protein A2V21_305200 [Deltaproteobacteria bacterium GWC2_55_46]HBG45892.1 hypothetical protein [Deltaproteobacteria bacterium]HCY09689.1 hypothetical protein [Deltaproteobacteria bacterium]